MATRWAGRSLRGGLPRGRWPQPRRQWAGPHCPNRSLGSTVLIALLAVRHAKGATLFAKQHHGAVYGQGVGLQGNSYALPTKDGSLRTLPLSVIAQHVDEFLVFAVGHPELTFQVTPIGCGLAGYVPAQIAPMFAKAPKNCVLPAEFVAVLGRG